MTPTDDASPFAAGPDGEQARAAQARRLSRLDGSHSLDRLAQLAARVLGTSSAQVSLISDVQTVVGGTGQAAESAGVESPAADSLCTVTVRAAEPLIVTDAVADGRVAHLPPVASGNVGSYLGVPLVSAGHVVGALCVFDAAPRTWTQDDASLLAALAEPVLAELELTALEADYHDDRLVWQLAVDAAGVGAFDWNLVTGELRWDERLLRLFGIDRATFGGTIEAFDELVHVEDRDRVSRALAQAVRACGEFAFEYRIVTPSGDQRWVAARGRALPGPDGSAVRVLGAASDTTAVREGEARVARVLEGMPTALFHLDREWRFTYANAEAERLLGGIGSDLVGGVVWELFPAAVGSDFERHYRRAVETGVPASFDAYYPPPLDAWYEVRAWPTADGLSVYFVDVTARRKAQDVLARTARRTALLSEVTDALTETLDAEEAVARLARLIVPPLGDWCVITLVDGVPVGANSDWRRHLRDVGWWHADPDRAPLVERYARTRVPALRDTSFVARALGGGRPVVVPERAADAVARVLAPGEAQDLCRHLDPWSGVIVPLRGRGRTLGLMTVYRDKGQPPFTQDDLDTLEEAAGRAGLALDNARLYGEQRDLAEALQRSMMTAPPEPDHLHVAVRYQPAAQAAQVGGDWYDAFLQTDGATTVVIGDVVGHDTAAAAAMGQVRTLLRGIAVTTSDSPAQVLGRVDDAMATLGVETTATVVVARLEQTPEERAAERTRLRWSNAGHPPPLVVEHRDGEPTSTRVLWSEEPDLLLGLHPGSQRRDSVEVLSRDSTVLLYTDGLVERRGQPLDEGVERLRTVLTELVDAGTPLEELCDRLLERMVPQHSEDDVALVAVRLHRQDD